MRLGKVVGQVVSTAKDQSLSGFTMLIIEPYPSPAPTSVEAFVAVDLVGAGADEIVLCTFGSGARAAASTTHAIIDAAVVAIADTVIRDGRLDYSK